MEPQHPSSESDLASGIEPTNDGGAPPSAVGVGATFGPSKPIQPPRLTDVAYDAIRAAIANGEFAPGDRLVEVRLARRLGMSAMPVRLALDRLCDERLVTRSPGRGASVAQFASPPPPSTSPNGGDETAALQPAPFASLADVATERIRSAIVGGVHRAGDRLVERELANDLGTSSVPVREALQRLHDEGLVERTQRRGVRVATMTRRDYDENAVVVEALSRCALDAIMLGEPLDFALSVHGLAQRAAALVATPTRSDVYDVDAALFNLIGASAGNELLASLLPRLRSRATAIQPAGGTAALDAERVAAWADGMTSLARASAGADVIGAGVALRTIVEALLPAGDEDDAATDGRPPLSRRRRRANGPRTELRLEWWGAQEAPGTHAWIDAVAAAFGAREDCEVTSRLLDTDELAGYRTPRVSSTADVCFSWNGLYALEAAWEGDLVPLETLIDPAGLPDTGATRQSVFHGQHYRVGFFAVGIGLALNLKLLERAGVDTDPASLRNLQLLDAADRLAASGTLPLTLGANDTYGSDWLFALLLVQQLERERDAHDLVLGRRAWSDTHLADAWQVVRTLDERGYLPPDAARWTTRDAVRLFLDGRAGMTLLNSGALPELDARLGSERVAFVPFPGLRPDGRYLGRMVVDSQGLAVPIRARNPELAGRFLAHAHTREWAESMWTLAGQLPASLLVDPAHIDDPRRRAVYEAWKAGAHAPYVTNLVPRPIRQRVIRSTLRDVLTARLAPADVPAVLDRACRSWRRELPGAVEHYAEWVSSFEDA